ncbi:hypothetical protein HK101_005492 [Irineochytrium annulatum]|nr:hypothetical protein HK101_005492 [Irineochytrium annulatum]
MSDSSGTVNLGALGVQPVWVVIVVVFLVAVFVGGLCFVVYRRGPCSGRRNADDEEEETGAKWWWARRKAVDGDSEAGGPMVRERPAIAPPPPSSGVTTLVDLTPPPQPAGRDFTPGTLLDLASGGPTRSVGSRSAGRESNSLGRNKGHARKSSEEGRFVSAAHDELAAAPSHSHAPHQPSGPHLANLSLRTVDPGKRSLPRSVGSGSHHESHGGGGRSGMMHDPDADSDLGSPVTAHHRGGISMDLGSGVAFTPAMGSVVRVEEGSLRDVISEDRGTLRSIRSKISVGGNERAANLNDGESDDDMDIPPPPDYTVSREDREGNHLVPTRDGDDRISNWPGTLQPGGRPPEAVDV